MFRTTAFSHEMSTRDAASLDRLRIAKNDCKSRLKSAFTPP